MGNHKYLWLSNSSQCNKSASFLADYKFNTVWWKSPFSCLMIKRNNNILIINKLNIWVVRNININHIVIYVIEKAYMYSNEYL